MSGILDSKSRVLDTIITTEGKKQLARGGIDIQYVSFTDGSTFYAADLVSGSQDATKRLYLESSQLPQDDLTFQSDSDGNVQPFRNEQDVQVTNGRILTYSFPALTSSTISGPIQTVAPTSGEDFIDKSDRLLASSVQNFKKLRLVATKDKIFEDDGFSAGPNQVSYTITNDRPIQDPSQHAGNIGALDSIFSDPRFSNSQNFKYLPPVNKIADRSIDRKDPSATSKYALGQYPPWGRTHIQGLTYQQVMSELTYYRNLGYERVISFDPTSRDNRLVGQFFERSFNTLKKLDVIDFGVHQTGNVNAPIAHVFFVGKVEVDGKGTDTFLHLFTLVFE